MRLDPVFEFVRHQVGNRFAIAADDNGRTVLFHPCQQAGKIGFRFMDIDRLHAVILVQLVHVVNCGVRCAEPISQLDFTVVRVMIAAFGIAVMFSIKNAVYVAIMQVGVIVVGVLAAGLSYKAWTDMGMALPTPIAMLINHTLLFLAIPLVWITFALLVRSRPEASDDVKNLAFWSGVFLLIALVVFVFHADVTPWFNIDWGFAGNEG